MFVFFYYYLGTLLRLDNMKENKSTRTWRQIKWRKYQAKQNKWRRREENKGQWNRRMESAKKNKEVDFQNHGPVSESKELTTEKHLDEEGETECQLLRERALRSMEIGRKRKNEQTDVSDVCAKDSAESSKQRPDEQVPEEELISFLGDDETMIL